MRLGIGSQSIQLERGGYCLFSDEGWTNYQHRHPYFQEICWVVHGRGQFEHAGALIPLQRGDCFISEPDVLHEISSPESEDLELFFMTFRLSDKPADLDVEAERIWQAFQHQHQIHTQISDPDVYWRLLRGAHPQRETLIMRSIFLESLHALTIQHAGEQRQYIDQHDPAEAAMAYIRAHAREAPSVSMIAEQVSLSERQLRRRFQERFGCGLVEAINSVRLEEARRMLLMQHSVSATARAVGISSPAMFSRLFKQAYGITPSQWRKQQVPSQHVNRVVFGAD